MEDLNELFKQKIEDADWTANFTGWMNEDQSLEIAQGSLNPFYSRAL